MAANPIKIRLSQGSEPTVVATPGKKIDDRHIRLEYMGGRCTVCRRSIKAVEKRYLTSKGAFRVQPHRSRPEVSHLREDDPAGRFD